METTDGLEEPQAGDAWVEYVIDRMLQFMAIMVGYELRPYQVPVARRILRSLIVGDAASITCLAARQSGKSEVLANTLAVAMVMLPLLARVYPERLGRFRRGLWVGAFAPTGDQADTLYNRIVERLTSPEATELLSDPEIDVRVKAGSKVTTIPGIGSLVRKQTANPKAKIEGKTYHVVLLDECQDIDEYVISKAISPMMASTAGFAVKTGTPNTVKGGFWKDIQMNKRKSLTARNREAYHFEWDWKEVAKCSPEYAKYIKEEAARIGEDSDEFKMAYALFWLLDQGMLTSSTRLDELGDVSAQELIKTWTDTPVVVGIDPGDKQDSCVVTVVFVDWDRPDEFGMYEHYVLNWLELHGIGTEAQYPQIVDFLHPYKIIRIAIDSNGMGGPVYERLSRLLAYKGAEIVPMQSDLGTQSERWKHLIQLLDRGKIHWPAGAKVRRLKTWQKFYTQMEQAEKHFKGPHIVVKAPGDAKGGTDDFVDSLALAVFNTKMEFETYVQVADNPFFSGRESRQRRER